MLCLHHHYFQKALNQNINVFKGILIVLMIDRPDFYLIIRKIYHLVVSVALENSRGERARILIMNKKSTIHISPGSSVVARVARVVSSIEFMKRVCQVLVVPSPMALRDLISPGAKHLITQASWWLRRRSLAVIWR